MLGVIFGLALGGVELWLLRKLADGVQTGHIPLWTVPLNIFALPVFLVPVALFKRQELALAGIAAAGVLIIGSVVLFMKNQKKGGGGK